MVRRAGRWFNFNVIDLLLKLLHHTRRYVVVLGSLGRLNAALPVELFAQPEVEQFQIEIRLVLQYVLLDVLTTSKRTAVRTD